MIKSEINIIQEKLDIRLPAFYINTILKYPFKENSFGEEFMLLNNLERILEYNGIFSTTDNNFAVGSDGGEYIYYLKLDGKDTVYIYDLEKSNFHNSIEVTNWKKYLENINKVHQEIEKDERNELERKSNKKWWQFWI